jgi:hypothetical protein
MQTKSGVSEQTTPTVDTSKYFTHINDMYTDNAPWRHRNASDGKLDRSIESTNSFFNFPLLQRRPRIRETRPLMKVNWRTVTAGFALKSALLL